MVMVLVGIALLVIPQLVDLAIQVQGRLQAAGIILAILGVAALMAAAPEDQEVQDLEEVMDQLAQEAQEEVKAETIQEQE